jgi:hypothetical protein
MEKICTWDQVFTTRNFVILYWYLFNKPNYQSGIAEDMRNLKKSEEFEKYIPSSLTYESNITNYLRKMEKHNLIGRINTEKKPYYFQALSFFYLDPFCIKTPNSRKKDIKTHFQEYSNHINELNFNRLGLLQKIGEFIGEDIISQLGFRLNRKGNLLLSHLSFVSNGKNNSIIPTQRIFQQYSCGPKEFMKKLSNEKIDYILLYELINLSFKQIHDLCNFRATWIDHEIDYWELIEMEEYEEASDIKNEFFADTGFPGLDMLDWKETKRLLDFNTLELIEQYDVCDWFGSRMEELLFELNEIFSAERYYYDDVHPIEKECWDILMRHVNNAKYIVEKQLKLYQQIERGNISLDDIISVLTSDT